MSSHPPSLLSLPPEIWLQIIAYLVVSPVPLEILVDFAPNSPPFAFDLTALRICKTINAEAAALFFRSNTFLFTFRVGTMATIDLGPPGHIYIQHVCEEITQGAMTYPAIKPSSNKSLLDCVTLRRMEHLEVVTSYDSIWFRWSGENYLSDKGRLLFNLLILVGGGENSIPEAVVKKNGTFRIIVDETFRLDDTLHKWRRGFYRPDHSRQIVKGLLQRVAMRRHLEVVIQGAPNAQVDDPIEYVLRMLKLAGP